MEPLFEVQSCMTKELFLSFQKLHLHLRLWNTVLLYFLGAAGILGGFSMIIVWQFPQIAAPLMIASACCLAYPIIPKTALRQAIITNPDRLNMPFTLRFYPAEYIEYSPRGEFRTAYAQLYKIVESDRLILLYQSKWMAQIVDKAAFSKGTPEELVHFLRDGRHIRYKRVK